MVGFTQASLSAHSTYNQAIQNYRDKIQKELQQNSASKRWWSLTMNLTGSTSVSWPMTPSPHQLASSRLRITLCHFLRLKIVILHFYHNFKLKFLVQNVSYPHWIVPSPLVMITLVYMFWNHVLPHYVDLWLLFFNEYVIPLHSPLHGKSAE